jgi:N-methylhydantoinase B
MATDKVLLEILNHRFTGIVEEMGYIIHRAGFTVFVKETWDFDSALVTPAGEVFSYPRTIGVTNMLGMHVGPAIAAAGDLRPGDVVMTNDPLRTQGMCTHLPDIMLFKPIFAEGRLLCFAWCFIHSSDVGGLVPGSIAPSAYDRHQEGVVIPPTKLVREGELNRELLEIFLANSRIPEQNWGDVKALLAALATAERRIGELVRRYGAPTVAGGMADLLDYGERRARQIIAGIPDGDYSFVDYLEGHGFSDYHARIKVRLSIRGSELHMDFGGTDPQLRAALNLPTFNRPNQWIVLGIVNFLRTMDRALPYNRGILRPVTVSVPEGSLLNPQPLAASGVRHTTGYRVKDAVLGALAQAMGGQIPACDSGQAAIILLSSPDPATGRYRLNVLQPMLGGSGARSTKDGIDGINFSAGSLRNVPTETIEREAGIFVRRYMLTENPAPGRFRGGTGIHFEFQVFSPASIVTARGMERLTLRAWGRDGGTPGTPGRATVNPGTPGEREIGRIDILKLGPGDVLRVVTPTGAGYGDPLERDSTLVLRDVRNGFLSSERARDDYGVVLRGEGVDEAATAALRAALGQARPGPAPFLFGPERLAYEARFPEPLQDLVAEALLRLPVPFRHYLKEEIYRRIEADGLAPAILADPARLDDVITAIRGATGRVDPTVVGAEDLPEQG